MSEAFDGSDEYVGVDLELFDASESQVEFSSLVKYVALDNCASVSLSINAVGAALGERGSLDAGFS